MSTADDVKAVSKTAQVTDFELSPELADFRARARAYADWLRPQAERWDREVAFPAEAVRRAGDQGLLKITIPRQYGGDDLGNLASCLMLEEVNSACPSTGVTISVHNSLFCSMLAPPSREMFWKVTSRDGSPLPSLCPM